MANLKFETIQPHAEQEVYSTSNAGAVNICKTSYYIIKKIFLPEITENKETLMI